MLKCHPFMDELSKMCSMPITGDFKSEGRTCKFTKLMISKYNHLGQLDFAKAAEDGLLL